MSTKTKLRDARNESIYSDYKRLTYAGFYPNVIQAKLSLKYFIAPETIARIFYNEKRKARQADQIRLVAQNEHTLT